MPRAFVATLLLLTSGASVPADAVPLFPGDAALLTGTDAVATPALAGPVRQQRLVPFQDDLTGGTNFSGRIELSVRGDGLPLTNEYRIVDFDDGGRGFRIEALLTQPIATSFDPIDVDYRTDAGAGTAPTTASYLDGESAVLFAFSEPVQAGGQSRTFFTTEPNDLLVFGDFGAAIHVRGPDDSLFVASFPSFLLYIPEPATGALVGLGLSAMAVRSRATRRRGRDGDRHYPA